MIKFTKRVLFGWRVPVSVRGRRIVVPVIATLLLGCCCWTFVAAIIDSGLREAGVLPTYTPTALIRDQVTPQATPQATLQAMIEPTQVELAEPKEIEGETSEPVVIETALPTATPVPTEIETSAPSATPMAAGPSAARAANLRDGPGTGYSIGGGVVAGQALAITAQNPAGDWLRLASGMWISAALVSNKPAALPVASDIPPLPATATPMPVRTAPPVAVAGRIRIIGLLRDGQAGRKEPDEYVEIQNAGAGPQDMTGWRLVSERGADDGQVFYFPQGFVMQPGQICRIYTAENHPESCGLSFNYTRTAVWNNSGSDAALLYDAAGSLVGRWD